MQKLQFSAVSAGSLAPGAAIAGTAYLVPAHKNFTAKRFLGSMVGAGYLDLEEGLVTAGVLARTKAVSLFFPAPGTQDVPDLHFVVPALHTVRCFVNSGAGPLAVTTCYWEGYEEP